MRHYTNRVEDLSERTESDDSSTSAQSICNTYEEGTVLTVKAHEFGNRLLTVRVLKIYKPFSFACVMKVEIIHGRSTSDQIPRRAVLKLFDRRIASNLRREHKVDCWTPKHEAAFISSIKSGEAAEFMTTLQQSEYTEPETGWSVAESEAYLQWWCDDMFATELETYRHLSKVQGRHIPKLFSPVSLFVRPPLVGSQSASSNAVPLLQVQGLLIEHIAGPTLVQMPDFISPGQWQAIADDAMDLVHILSNYEVVNEGIKASNIIAGPENGPRGRHRVVMVDFAQCRIRPNGQSDTNWGKIKAEQDEEGVLAQSILAILRKVGFEWQHSPSHRFRNFEGSV